MERVNVGEWISAILVISPSARKRLFPDFSRAPLQQSPANRSAFVRKGNDLGGRKSCTDPGHGALSERRTLSRVSGLAPPRPTTRYFSGSLSFSKPFDLFVFAIDTLRANELPVAATPSEVIRATFVS